MSGELGLGLLMASAAFTLGTATGWVVVAATMPFLNRLRGPARSRAVVLAQLRLMPLAIGIVLVVAQVSAFARFEQSRAESAGPLLITLAMFGFALAADAIWRAGRCWRATSALISRWRHEAEPLVLGPWHAPAWLIRPAYPVVAVIGALRPELFVAHQVVERCTAEELSAIAAHEAAHVEARDNLLRLLFALTPGAALCSWVARALERTWSAAAEHAADVAAGDRAGCLPLASALTKVARLAPLPVQAVAASGLIGTSDLDARVRRLLEPSEQQRARVTWLPAATLLIAALAFQLPFFSAKLHDVFELLVRSN